MGKTKSLSPDWHHPTRTTQQPNNHKMGKKGKQGGQQAKGNKTYKIDCTDPVKDKIVETKAVAEFLKEKIKVDGKTGNLGDKINVTTDERTITVVVDGAKISKRYLKYLVKKWLKKNEMREWVRIISTNSSTYKMKYFQVNNEEEADE